MSASSPPFLISIVIPCYNSAATLERVLTSALSQPGEDFDLWLVDDGSRDATPALAAEWQQRWPGRFNYLRQPNAGPAAARNRGLDASGGAYLLFVDGDDELLPDAIAHFRAAIAARPNVQVFLAGHESLGANGKLRIHAMPPLAVSAADRVRAYLLEKSVPICHGAVLFRRDVFAAYRYPESFRSAEDIAVFVHAIATCTCSVLPCATVRVHQHGDSLRGNAVLAAQGGLRLIDEVFDAQRLPAEVMALRAAYAVRRHLSLFRTLSRSALYREALVHYREALRLAPREALRVRYWGKLLHALLAAVLRPRVQAGA